MITIIHGADTALSRKYFLETKQKNSNSVLLDGANITLTDLVQNFEGGELFGENKEFFIEQLLGKRKKSKELDLILDYIKEADGKNNIYLWEGSELTAATLNKFKNPIVKSFKLPQTLFAFLESIKPNNVSELIPLFHSTIDVADVEMVFFMMVRQVRMLLGIVEPSNDSIDELKRMAPWQKSKIQNQADLFEVRELKKLYRRLFEIEKGMKTGNLSSNLTQTIDFLLLDI